MLEKLESIVKRFDEIEQRLSDVEIASDVEALRKLSKERSDLEPIVLKYQALLQLNNQIVEDENLLDSDDEELREMARDELEELKDKKSKLEQELKLLLLPKDPNDDKNAILEIRAGTGGEEAAIFAADLFRMYQRYAENKGWKVEELSSSPTGIGGFKEIIALISGNEVYGILKFESGVHRVQRVPVTESSGRIHTSAATVAVLPEAKEVDVEIDPSDLRIDTFRASGAGGQHVNKVESAIRITHLPTGLVVSCQDEKSQHKNKARAMKILRSRLLSLKQQEMQNDIAAKRRSMVSTGDRSAKIRTYNFPQGRVTDHRIKLTLHQLEQIMAGGLDELVEQLRIAHNMELLEKETAAF